MGEFGQMHSEECIDCQMHELGNMHSAPFVEQYEELQGLWENVINAECVFNFSLQLLFEIF
jgi:hypothetical protein